MGLGEVIRVKEVFQHFLRCEVRAAKRHASLSSFPGRLAPEPAADLSPSHQHLVMPFHAHAPSVCARKLEKPNPKDAQVWLQRPLPSGPKPEWS